MIPLATSSLAVAMSMGGLGLVLQLYLADRGVSTFWIGMLGTLSAAGMLTGGLTWGTISDRIRRRPLLIGLSVSLAVAIGLLVLLPPTEWILGTALVRRFLLAGFATVAVAIVSSSSTISRRGKNVSYIASASAAGRALGLIAMGFCIEMVGFQFSFAVVAVLPLVALGAVALLPSDNPMRPAVDPPRWRQIRSTGLLDLYVAAGLRQMAIFGTFSLLFVYMRSIGIAPGLMGVLGSINTFIQVLALVGFGWLADRVGRRRIFMLGFALSAITPCLFVVLANAYGMAIGYVAQGLSFSALHVGSTAYIGDQAPHHRQGQLLGLLESSRGLGGVFGPMLAGAVVPLAGFAWMFVAMSGIGSVGFLVLCWGQRVRRRQPRADSAPA